MGLSIPVIYGSVRSDRQGIKAAHHIVAALKARGHDAVLVDPLVEQLPLLDRMYKEYKGDAPPGLERLAALYRGADGFLICSGEYNNGIPPALKNLLDHFLEEYFWRPSAILSYSAGRFGGVRAAMQLRMTLAELGMPSIPSLLAIGQVQNVFADDGSVLTPDALRGEPRFLDEFEWYCNALKAARAAGVPY
jgi:NAD(P)H-dependent FMN reductase